MKRIVPSIVFLLWCGTAQASSGELFNEITIPFLLILIFAKLFGLIAIKCKLPSLVGEILGGIVLGNLVAFGIPYDLTTPVLQSSFFQYAAELGVILLLFLVGLESNVKDIIKSGLNSSITAVIGVILPVGLGYLAALCFGFDSTPKALLVGSVLAATSVGITAKVLTESGKLKSPSAQIILGAAVIDDVLGLILLAVLSGMGATGHVDLLGLGVIILKVIAFFCIALLFGNLILPRAFRHYIRVDHPGFLPVFALIFALTFAKLSLIAGLAPIIGAFTAGLLLDDIKLQSTSNLRIHQFEDVIKPMADLLLPLFLVSIGLQVKLSTFTNTHSLGLILLFTAIALISKTVCGQACRGAKLDKWGIGFGMIPRGEVGLIFASFGLSQGMIDQTMYGILILVVLLTTIIGPMLLKMRLKYF